MSINIDNLSHYIGARIFVNSIENGMWCRGTITELIPIESENIRKLCNPTKFPVSEVALIQIFMVDFGNSEVLIVPGYAVIICSWPANICDGGAGEDTKE